MNWHNSSRSFPTKEGHYDCVIEYDLCGHHRIRRQIVLWAQGHWCGLQRDDDVITFWKELSADPTGARCSKCGWPVNFCRCSSAARQFM